LNISAKCHQNRSW